jgi:hypothetical protein
MSYIGSTPTTQSFISGTDYFNGTGSQTAFTLSRNVASVNDVEAVVNNVVQRPNDAYTISGTTITFTSAPSAGTGNIYVRYLSTTTQSITPSQNTVSYSTLNTDMQSGGYASNFKNRLINGDMTISQRNGTSSITANNTGDYTLDRWKYFITQTGKFTVQQNAGGVTPPAGFTNYLGVTSTSAYSIISSDYFDITQPIEGFNVADLGWGTANAQTITVSFWVRSSLTGTFGGGVTNSAYNRSYPFPYTINAANTWEYKTVTIPGDTTGTWLTDNSRGIELSFGLGNGSANSGTANTWQSGWDPSPTGAVSVVGTNGATWYVTGVQLEKGSTATSFDYLTYTTELQLCQRYYQQFGGEANYQFYGTGIAQATTASSVLIYHPVTMRTAPSFSSVSATSLQIFGTGGGAVSSLSLDTGATTCSAITAFRSGLTAANGYMLINNNSTAPRLQFSAEL